MIIVLKTGVNASSIKELSAKLETQGVAVSHFTDIKRDFLGLIGDTSGIDIHHLKAAPEVEQVIRVEDPYKRANRKFHPENSIITVGNETIGGQSIDSAECSSSDPRRYGLKFECDGIPCDREKTFDRRIS